MFLQQHFHTNTTKSAPLHMESVKPCFGRTLNSNCIDARAAILFAVLLFFAYGSDKNCVHMVSRSSPNKNILGPYHFTFILPQTYSNCFEKLISLMAGELHRAEVMSSKGGRRETPDVALLQSLFAEGGRQTNAMDITLFAAGTEKRFQMTRAKGLQFQDSTCQEGHSLLPS